MKKMKIYKKWGGIWRFKEGKKGGGGQFEKVEMWCGFAEEKEWGGLEKMKGDGDSFFFFLIV